MTPERYGEVKVFFQKVIEMPPDRRRPYLESNFGSDPEMRSEIESLLAVYNPDASQLMEEQLADLLPDLGSGDPFAPGKRIGPYRIERLLGEGGMGSVYEASRADDQFRQRVALKLVKASVLSSLAIRRFQRERQILADLIHPHIARLLDGGVDADGRPYLVMEYVDGMPIDRYCREKDLSIRKRIEVFRAAADAVQYAHQNLVIHRDLKPANILVTSGGTVKLLDFGIAKLVGEEEDAGGSLTGAGMRLLTPDYASPEQVRGASVGTATDVYSLGIVLYELLTRRRPFNLGGKTLPEIDEIICGRDPEKPSTAVTWDPQAAAPHSTTRKFRRELEGDLDNIVLMALRKEPQRRYASVEQLSRDLGNYLESLPVIARTSTFNYRAGKFVSRHKTAVIAACVVFVAVAGGAAATVWEARIAVRERAGAVRRFNDVRHLAHAFLFDFNDSLKSVSGSTAARKLIVAKGLQYLDTLAAEAGSDLALIRELGSGYIRVGDVQGNPVQANLGDSKGAIASYRKAVAVLEPLAAKGDYDSRAELAVSLTRLADLLWAGGDSNKALVNYRRALESQVKLVAERPSDTLQLARTGYNRNNIGDLLLESNDLDNAEASYRKGLEISEAIAARKPGDRQARQDLSLSEMKLGDVAWYRGDWKKALEFYRKGTGIREALLAERPEDSVLRHSLIASYSSIGDTLAKQHDLAGAVTEYRKALKMGDALASADPANHQAQRDRLVCLMNLSELLEKQGRTNEAADNARIAIETATRIAATDAGSRLALKDLADAQERRGDVAMHSGDLEEAWKLHSAAAETRERILHMGTLPEAMRDLGSSYLTLASVARRLSTAATLPTQERSRWQTRSKESIARARSMGEQIRKQTNLTVVDREFLRELDTIAAKK